MPTSPALALLLGDLRALVRGAAVVGTAAALATVLAWALLSPVLRGAGLTGDGVPGTVRDLAVLAALVGALVGSWVLTRRRQAGAAGSWRRGTDGVGPGRPR